MPQTELIWTSDANSAVQWSKTRHVSSVSWSVHCSDEPCSCQEITAMWQYNIIYYNTILLPSLLWRCWLSSRKGIRPVKTKSWVVRYWRGYLAWSKVQMICIWSSWCHCHPIISYSSKIQNGLPFLCRLTQVVLEKRPLNGCSVVVVV